MTREQIRKGDVLDLGAEVGILYKIRPLRVSVISVFREIPYGGVWVTAYELDKNNQAKGKRELYIPNVAGVVRVDPSSLRPVAPRRRTVGANAG